LNGNAKKGCLWALNPEKIEKMEEEIAKHRKKDLEAIKISMAMPGKYFDLNTTFLSIPIFSGLRAHKQPFLALPFNFGVSTLAKHLLRDRLCLTEF
jgi:hypothetical protein